MTSPSRFPLEIYAWRLSPHTMTQQHASVFHYSSDVASWMSTLVPAWRNVKPSGPAQRRAVWVDQKHEHAGLLSAAKRRAQITRTKSICVRSICCCSRETRGGASSSAAAIILPSKSAKPVLVNPRNGIRSTSNNLVIALSVLGIPLQIPSGVPCVRQ